MRFRRPLALAALAVALALPACQEPDVGQPCSLDVVVDGGSIDTTADGGTLCSAEAADFFRTGAIECDNLVCIRSPTGPCPGIPSAFAIRKYCSKPCVSDGDCFNSQTGLVCRQVVLDPTVLAPDGGLADGGQPYLGQIPFSNYCATPVTQ